MAGPVIGETVEQWAARVCDETKRSLGIVRTFTPRWRTRTVAVEYRAAGTDRPFAVIELRIRAPDDDYARDRALCSLQNGGAETRGAWIVRFFR